MASQIQQQLAVLDEHPDKLHLDRTPAVGRLIEIGEPALAPLVEHLAHADWMHRQRAQRAVEGITRRVFGFDGSAWPEAALERWTTWWSSIAYDARDDEPARTAAIDRLRIWLAARAR